MGKAIDYQAELNNARLRDDEGDLGYTVHVTKAIDICQRVETHYLTEQLATLQELVAVRKELKALKEAKK